LRGFIETALDKPGTDQELPLVKLEALRRMQGEVSMWS
jgi:hypothetical protein